MPRLKFSNPSVKGLSYIICAAIMTGCVSNPAQEVVVSKNDGSFDANVIQTATESVNNDGVDATQKVHYSESFTSTDGTVEFTMNIDEGITLTPMTVAEVAPHYLTEEDAKRVADVLFGDVVFYEAEPALAPVLSKEDIQKMLSRWSKYTNADALLELFSYRSDQPEYQESIAEVVKKFVEEYTSLYELAPDGNPHRLCEWTFKPDSFYSHSAGDLVDKNLSQDNEKIGVQLEIGDVPYRLYFTKRNKDDYKLSNISAYISSYISPRNIDDYYFKAQFCRTHEPTEAQIADIKNKAQQTLNDMELGEWLVDECYVETSYTNEYAEYVIHVNAVPVINGVPAMRRPQLTNLKSDTAYASNYYLSDVNFAYSANGDLLSFSMYSAIDVKQVINDNVATLSMDNLMEKAKIHLSLSDYGAYGMPVDVIESWEKDFDERIICKVDIQDLEYGLIRVKVPNTDESYYYVPAVIVSGSIDYSGEDTGTVFASSGGVIWNERVVPLVAINAVDGTVIELGNE